MSLTNFCCCCDLRRGCIIFAWLQMMGITMTIATLIAYSDMMTVLVIETTKKSIYDRDNTNNFTALYAVSNVTAVLKIIIGVLFIKAVTCVALTWGVVKKCHLYYQPWLFITGIESSILSLEVFVMFILGIVLSPLFLISFIFSGASAALNWYFWACVYTVYRKDMKPSSISFELQYENFMEPTLL